MEKIGNSVMYSEVYELINVFGVKYKNAIPKKIYSFIEDNRDKDYTPTYDIDIPLTKQNISKKSAALIMMLYYNYWCTSEEEKKEVLKLLDKNEKINREKSFEYEKKWKDNLQKQKSETKNIERTEIELKSETKNIESTELVVKDGKNPEKTKLMVKDKTNIFSRIISFIKNIFKR